MSVYAQWAPYSLRGQTWDQARDAFADAIVKTLAAHAPDLPSLILAREILTPVDLEQRYGLTGGHIFHGEHALDQLYAMRPVLGWAQHRTPIAGLYLCGAGTHPGGGLTGAPGAHAARIVLKDPTGAPDDAGPIRQRARDDGGDGRRDGDAGGSPRSGAASDPTGIFGFRSASLAGEQELERRFLALPSADRAREYHRFLTNEPHVAGSDRNRALAEWVRDRWIDYGIDEVSIVEHEVLLPWPEDVSVEIAARSWKATLYEDPIPGDPDTRETGPALSRLFDLPRLRSANHVRRERQS